MRKLVFGIGTNNAEYNVEGCLYYRKWYNMLRRCYRTPQHPAYIGVTVCKEWHRFNNFKTWMKDKEWEGLELDKDLRVVGNKVYSPETCMFVPSELNNLLARLGTNNYEQRPSGNWAVHTSIKNKKVGLGTYKTEAEAMEVVKLHRVERLKSFQPEYPTQPHIDMM